VARTSIGTKCFTTAHSRRSSMLPLGVVQRLRAQCFAQLKMLKLRESYLVHPPRLLSTFASHTPHAFHVHLL